jgi:4-alpha-glucanotransferase
MAQARILSYRVLFFERDEQGFLAPDDYPQLALAVAGNHDLPTLRGWWEDRDIALKERLGFLPGDDEAKKQTSARATDRLDLVRLLKAEGLLGEHADMDAAAFEQAVHAFLARSKAALALVQIDDVIGEKDQVNLPGATDEYPNWRRRLSQTLEEIAESPSLRKLGKTFAARGGK